MKTIFLKSNKLESLIKDIKLVVTDYNGEKEFTNGDIHIHLIGKKIKQTDIDGNITEWYDGFHANLLVSDDFNESILGALVIPKPNNPFHRFA